jgi:glutathione S-transferase
MSKPLLQLHYHPLSSYCHKLLIALRELGTPVEKHLLNLGDPEQRAAFVALWPTGKMPLLIDGGQPIAESSIIIEYLQQRHAAPGRSLIPKDPEAALPVRLWDRLFDLYVMTPMQALTAELLRPAGERNAAAEARAREALARAYAMADTQLQQGHSWVASDSFSLADCAAAPALFYAVTYVPIEARHAALKAYFERLMARESVAQTVDEARPYFRFYPGRAGLERRFYEGDQREA